MSTITAGIALLYEMADFDASDEYVFAITRADDGLAFSFGFEGEEPEESVHVSAAALAGARTIAVLSQGGWLTSALESPKRDADEAILLEELPPFLLSRTALRELREGKTQLKSEWSSQDDAPAALTLEGRATASIVRHGETEEVPVLVARSDDMTLKVLDDETWPLVIEREEGDNYWRLIEIERAGASGDEDEDDE